MIYTDLFINFTPREDLWYFRNIFKESIYFVFEDFIFQKKNLFAFVTKYSATGFWKRFFLNFKKDQFKTNFHVGFQLSKVPLSLKISRQIINRIHF